MEVREEPSREGALWMWGDEGGGKAAKCLMGADLQAWAAWWGHMGSVACLGHDRPPRGRRDTWLSSQGARWQTGHPHLELPTWVTQPGLLVRSLQESRGLLWTSEGPGWGDMSGGDRVTRDGNEERRGSGRGGGGEEMGRLSRRGSLDPDRGIWALSPDPTFGPIHHGPSNLQSALNTQGADAWVSGRQAHTGFRTVVSGMMLSLMIRDTKGRHSLQVPCTWTRGPTLCQVLSKTPHVLCLPGLGGWSEANLAFGSLPWEGLVSPPQPRSPQPSTRRVIR